MITIIFGCLPTPLSSSQLLCYLSLFSDTMIKHSNKTELGGRWGRFHFTLQLYSIMKEVRASAKGRNLRQELKQSLWVHEGTMVTGLLPQASSVFLLIYSRTTFPGMALPTVGWTLPYQPSVKEVLHKPASRPIWWRHFLNWECLFSVDSSLSKSNKDIHISTTLRNLEHKLDSVVYKYIWSKFCNFLS